MELEGKDGVDYINIYSQGLTPLGRSLSNWNGVVSTRLGFFRSLEGFIFFLGSFDASLRGMGGAEAKSKGDKLDRGIRLPQDVFRELIVEAMYDKIKRDPGLALALKENTLPLVHYYSYSGKKIFAPKWDWQVKEWENIAKELRNV